MERARHNAEQDGATRALVTVLRALLDAQPAPGAVRERVHAQYQQALAQIEGDPTLAGERASFERVFDLLGMHATGESHHIIKELRRAGHLPDVAAADTTDGVDDASMY